MSRVFSLLHTHTEWHRQRARKRRSANRHFLLFPLVLIYLEFLLRLFNKNIPTFRAFFYPIIFAVSLGIFLSALTTLFPQKVNFAVTVFLLVTITFYYGLHCFVQNGFHTYMTPNAILHGAGGVAKEWGKIVFKTLILGLPKILLFYLPTILYIWFGRFYAPTKQRPPVVFLFLFVFSLLVFGVGLIASLTGSTKTKYTTQYNFNTATETFGLATSTRISARRYLFGKDRKGFSKQEEAAATPTATPTPTAAATPTPTPVVYEPNIMDLDLASVAASGDETVKELCDYISSQPPSMKNEYTGLFAGKNLIMICAEAFSDCVISEELTPTLYRLAHNGFYFSDFYQPSWGGSTSTGEFSMLVGLIPMHEAETIMETVGHNNYFTPGNQLQRQGYFSAAYHCGEYEFYHRDQTHENLGYDTWLASGNGLNEIVNYDLSDESLLTRTPSLYLDKAPFSIYYMTYSAHSPYEAHSDYFENEENLAKVEALYGDIYKPTTLNYLSYNLELEKGLAALIRQLEETGIADDTVICLTSDHCPYGLEESISWGNAENYLADLYGGSYETPWEKDHNALILWSGSLENKDKDKACEISAPTSSIDIVPTLSNLFGWEYDSRLLPGRDVFSDQEPIVIWSDYSWLTEKGAYHISTDTFTPAEGQDVDDSYVSRIHRTVNDKILLSEGILEEDFYGLLFGPDPDGS